jgi:hypothetical protein
MEHYATQKRKNQREESNTMNIQSTVSIIIGITLVTAVGASQLQHITSEKDTIQGKAIQNGAQLREAPVAISGENVFVAWWTNNTANNNEEIMFRASTDAGATFGDKINLSNTTGADSWKVEIDSEADSVVVTWWETNQTSDTPVMRVSTDNGATFGPMLMLATNGTIGEEGE